MMRCRLGWHDWTRWKLIRIDYYRNAKFLGTQHEQIRECRRCGKRQQRELTK